MWRFSILLTSIILHSIVVRAKKASNCPSTHPYAYRYGEYCCKYNKEKVDPNYGAMCDGSTIGFSSRCCKDDAYEQCPSNDCGNYVFVIGGRGVEETACKDQLGSCAYWAKEGYCDRSPSFMKTYCASSCNLCKGKYSEWTSWSKCSRDCGTGRQMRARICDKSVCDGPDTEIAACDNNCAGKGKYGEWTSWSTCSKTCGTGRQMRVRTCEKSECDGPSAEMADCDNNCAAPVPNKHLNAITCGKRTSRGRIVGGKSAEIGDWPWQIAIMRKRVQGVVFCGGTLVNSRTVLTAAHCFQGVNEPQAGDYYVRIGELNLDLYDDSQEDVRVAKIFRHEGFNRQTYENDIAVMILEIDITRRNFVNAACVSEDTSDIEAMVGKNCSITGWGKLAQDGILARVLQYAQVPIVNAAACKGAFADIAAISIKKSMFCAGYKEGGIDSCKGDSGGPLVCQRSDKTYVLHGIVSWGIGCANAGKYGVYTKVSDFTVWLADKVYAPK